MEHGRGMDGVRFSELRGKRMLVVGLGGIGTEVARRAHGFGLKVDAVDPQDLDKPDFVFHLGKPAEMLSWRAGRTWSSTAPPLTAETTRMYGGDFFSSMKPTAFFLSVGRGKSTDTEALVAALRAGRIAGAGLDVTDPEPLPDDHALWTFSNVVITPHIASRSTAATVVVSIFIGRTFVVSPPASRS